MQFESLLNLSLDAIVCLHVQRDNSGEVTDFLFSSFNEQMEKLAGARSIRVNDSLLKKFPQIKNNGIWKKILRLHFKQELIE
ncbi:MAG: hypothetical protein ACOCUT_03665, partial [bacterium]